MQEAATAAQRICSMQQASNMNAAEPLANVFAARAINFSVLSGVSPYTFTPISVGALNEQQNAANAFAKQLHSTAAMSLGGEVSTMENASALSNMPIQVVTTQVPQRVQPTTPTPQLDLVSLPTGFEPISPLDFHLRADSAADSVSSSSGTTKPKSKAGDSADALSNSTGFRPAFMQTVSAVAKQRELEAGAERVGMNLNTLWKQDQSGKSNGNGNGNGNGSSNTGPDTPSKKRRKAQLEFIDAHCELGSPIAGRFETVSSGNTLNYVQQSMLSVGSNQTLLPNGNQAIFLANFNQAPFGSSVQQSFAAVLQSDAADRTTPLRNGASLGVKRKSRRGDVQADEVPEVYESNRPARIGLIREHYSFHTKWTRTLKRRHFERPQHVTGSRVAKAKVESQSCDSQQSDDCSSNAEDANADRVRAPQSRARLRIAGVLEQLDALRYDDAELKRRTNQCSTSMQQQTNQLLRSLDEAEKRVALHSEQLRVTLDEASHLLLDAFSRHSKLRRAVKLNGGLRT